VENANSMEEAARAQMLSRVYALGAPTRRDPEHGSLDPNAGLDGMLARLRGVTSVR
jgi:hypothetical protein